MAIQRKLLKHRAVSLRQINLLNGIKTVDKEKKALRDQSVLR